MKNDGYSDEQITMAGFDPGTDAHEPDTSDGVPDQAETAAPVPTEPANAEITEPARPKPAEPTMEQWNKLYEVAGLINKIAPWEHLWDSDLITIMLPGREEPVYCSVMGMLGECYAIGVFPGYQALGSLNRMRERDEDEPYFISGLEQMCLMCHFGDREEVTPKDREVYKALGLKFRGRNQWVYFRAMEPGFHPWFIDMEQADLLIQVLQNLVMAYKHLMSGELKVDFEGGESFLRFYSPEKELWLNTAAKVPSAPVDEAHLVIEDELLIARLKSQKKNNQILEYDLVYLPMPIQEHKEDRPYLPRLLMLADKKSGLPFGQNVMDAREGVENAVIDMLVKHIGKYGRPSAIYIRDERMERYVEDICHKLEIKLLQGKGMPVMNGLLEDMLGFM